MVNFIDFPIFDGVSCDLRQWIVWMENFFVRERFTEDEKMNLAQSLLEGKAESWFYSIQKTLIFYDWRELKDNLLLRFGDFADPDRIRLIDEHDRFFKDLRDAARIQRRKTTSIPEKDTIKETIPKFDGTNAYDWLSKVERFFRVGRYADCDKLDLVSLSLEGDVLKWFNWKMLCSKFHSWDKFRRRFLLKFGAAPAKSSENVAEILEEKASYPEKKGLVSAHVTEFEELSSQVVGLDDYHLEQIFDNGLQTEMKEVLKLPESMGLENQKPAGTFTYKPVASVNSLSFAVGKMDSTNGNGVDVEAANGANAANGGGDIDALPPSPPILPPNVEPLHVKTAHVEKKNLRVPMAQTGIGTKGQKIPLFTNHFKVDVADLQGHFYHYSVPLFYHDDRPVEAKGIGSNILDKVHEPYHSDLDGKGFAYDGEKTLFTDGVLPDNKMDFAVVLEEVSAAMTNGNARPNGTEHDGGDIIGCRGLGQLILDDVKSHMRHKWKSKHLRAAYLQTNPSYALDVVTQPITECNTTAALIPLLLERSVSHVCFLGSLRAKKNVSWLGVVCVWAECMMHTTPVISAKFYSLFSCEVDTEENMSSGLSQTSQVWEPGGVLAANFLVDWLLLLEFVLFIHLEDKVCLSGASNSGCDWLVFDRGKNNKWDVHVDSLIALQRVMRSDLEELCVAHENGIMRLKLLLHSGFDARFGFVSVLSQIHAVPLDVKQDFMQNHELTQSHKKQKFSKNWWYKFKHSLWQRECGRDLLEEEVLVHETVVDVRFVDVGRRELLLMFSKAFVHLYPSFKLEDKLGLQGVSIDTLPQLPAQQDLAMGVDDVAEAGIQVKTRDDTEALLLRIKD